MSAIMASLPSNCSASVFTLKNQLPCFSQIPKSDKRNKCRSVSWESWMVKSDTSFRRTELPSKNPIAAIMSSSKSPSISSDSSFEQKKRVWIWTEDKQVMTAAVERGWNTFLFSNPELALKWSSIALINPLYIEEGSIFDSEKRRVATIIRISTPEELQQLQPEDWQPHQSVIIDLLDWQIIPAENIVATFQGSQNTVFAISRSQSEAQVFLEALEHGLGGVVLKAEDVNAVIDLKDYFDRRDEVRNQLSLTKATITKISAAGMGDRVCVDLCSLMRPGEGLLVGSFARGLFLVHSECLESNYISSQPFRVNAGPVHAYVAVPGGKTCYLSELKAGKEVIIVDQLGFKRTAIVGRVKIETRPLLLVQANVCHKEERTVYSSDNQEAAAMYSVFLQNAETVALICSPSQGNKNQRKAIPVTSLKAGDEVLLRVQGGARHTGIEIHEFIVEN